MRVYIHHDREPEFTLALKTDESSLIQDVLHKFVIAFNRKNQPTHSLEATRVALVNERRRHLAASTTLKGAGIKEGSDLFVDVIAESVSSTAPTQQQQRPEQSAAPFQESTTTPVGNGKTQSETSSRISTAENILLTNPAVAKWAEEITTDAEKAFQSENYKRASTIYEQIMILSPDHETALMRLGDISMKIGKFEKAVDLYSRLTVAYPFKADYHTKLGDALAASGKPKLAIAEYYRSVSCVPQTDVDAIDNLRVRIARMLYTQGETDPALQTITGILHRNQDHRDALVEYGQALIDRNMYQDALRVFLRLLISHSQDKLVRRQLSTLVKAPQGCDLLLSELQEVPGSAPALAFLATVIKDFGAVHESIRLYEKTVLLAPSSPSYCLNLVHTLEVACNYRRALQVMTRFLKQNPDLSVGPVKCSHVLPLLPPLALLPNTGTANIDTILSQFTTPPTHTTNDTPSSPAVPQEEVEKDVLVVSDLSKALPNTHKAYGPDELDLLALFMTLTKIFFVTGLLKFIAPLSKIIEPLRKGRELHLTSIRNEQAYYACIHQLMSLLPLPLTLSLPPSTNPIYLVGDSHSLAPSWHTVTCKGEARLLKNALVTGLKAWHMRPDSVFFPKSNLHNMLDSSVPKGSDTIFMFGEIDCREGLLLCVDKCKYKDLEEGVRATVKIYIEALLDIISIYDYTIYVHPISPVLDVTRHIVKLYNKVLKEQVLLTPKLHWLDFFDALLTADGTSLRPEYVLDGTHLNPAYVSLLSSALSKLLWVY
mmetsp:Transcript_187/g.368  ORF Transcript_187/g.368 Transcript_187/m.368 type:complete len:770 (+) Transcript_187:70-2379(+)